MRQGDRYAAPLVATAFLICADPLLIEKHIVSFPAFSACILGSRCMVRRWEAFSRRHSHSPAYSQTRFWDLYVMIRITVHDDDDAPGSICIARYRVDIHPRVGFIVFPSPWPGWKPGRSQRPQIPQCTGSGRGYIIQGS